MSSRRRVTPSACCSRSYNEAGLPDPQSLLAHFRLVTKLLRTGRGRWPHTPRAMGGPAEAVMKMAFGNGFGFDFR